MLFDCLMRHKQIMRREKVPPPISPTEKECLFGRMSKDKVWRDWSTVAIWTSFYI